VQKPDIPPTPPASREPSASAVATAEITPSAKTREQIDTEECSCSWFMQRPSFMHGVEDVRAGRPARFDTYAANTNSLWAYEKGRQFATIVSRSLPLTLNGKLNRKALRLFKAAVDRGDITP
jgi:hypothetical protein